MLNFKEYITEGKTYDKGTLSIFDIDDTLFHTTAKIEILRKGKVVKQLTPSQFNTYKENPKDDVDFSQFTDSDKFYNESTPIKKMFNRAKAILRNVDKHPNNKVILLTARTDMNNREKFLDTFRKFDFNIDKVRVERAGRIGGNMYPAEAKAIIVYNYLKTKQFNKVKLFDDSINNLIAFLKLKTHFPTVKFEAYLAHKDGTVTPYKL